ncbi:MAG TPA: hypothetical protein ENH29_00565 [Bacteroidetes bacterium]|nr:hypothetical protein [Bacteroidota bacterium]
MKSGRMKSGVKLIFLIGILFGISMSCTENPFKSADKILNNSISGKVALNTDAGPKGVYVWFKALNVNAWADESGSFTLNIPPPAQQPGGGIDGIFKLYFYCANYQLQSVQIALFNGNVQYSKQDLNNKGELKATVRLRESLHIITTYGPRDSTETGTVNLLAYFTLQAKFGPSTVTGNISLAEFQGDPEYLTGFLVDPNGNFVKVLQPENRGRRTSNIEIDVVATTLEPVMVSVKPGFPGTYQVIPYLIINRKNLPAGLLQSMGAHVLEPTAEFLKIPLKIENNKFKIGG